MFHMLEFHFYYLSSEAVSVNQSQTWTLSLPHLFVHMTYNILSDPENNFVAPLKMPVKEEKCWTESVCVATYRCHVSLTKVKWKLMFNCKVNDGVNERCNYPQPHWAHNLTCQVKCCLMRNEASGLDGGHAIFFWFSAVRLNWLIHRLNSAVPNTILRCLYPLYRHLEGLTTVSLSFQCSILGWGGNGVKNE